MRKIFHILAMIGLVLFTVAATVLVMGRSGMIGYQDPVSQKVAQAAEVIDTVFVGEHDATLMGDAAVAAIIASLGDRWSYYISAEDYAAYEAQMTNSYVGIGITIQTQMQENGLLVTDVTPGGPAEAAGIQAGDILTEVEGQSVVELGREQTVAQVRGEPGTEVNLTLLRGTERYDCAPVRQTVQDIVVESKLLADGIGYISIDNFDLNSAEQTIAAVDAQIEAGATALIFDVRNNPGGMKDELVEILDYLLADGQPVFTSKSYTGQTVTDYTEDGHAVDLPMAVLVNAESYSAAEFFAAALQELEAARVVGEPTSGKGYFQITYPLSDGSAMAISSGEYFTPNGLSLANVGITPDETVSLSDEAAYQLYLSGLAETDDVQLQAAIAWLEHGK